MQFKVWTPTENSYFRPCQIVSIVVGLQRHRMSRSDHVSMVAALALA